MPKLSEKEEVMTTTLVGKNHYDFIRKKNMMLAEFVSKYGELGVERYDAGANESTLHDAFNGLALFAEKKLIIIDEPSENKNLTEYLQKLIESKSKDVEVLILEPIIDKRTAWYKFLSQNTSIIECDELDERSLVSWIGESVKERGGTITSSAALLLIKNVGINQQQLANELDKLLLFNSQITEESVELLVDPMPQENVFNLLESLTKGDAKNTIYLYEKLKLAGVDPHEILAMIAWQLHSILLVKSSLKNPQDSGLHSFVFQKNQGIAKRLTFSDLENLVSKVIETELIIKKDGAQADSALSVLLYQILDALK